ncbi:hypothetical protein JNM87_00365 [Candidatus Saccharibacteria bacterium]|nr:hypothetical protein [Candidatus Saccharibacteria bacterium]
MAQEEKIPLTEQAKYAIAFLIPAVLTGCLVVGKPATALSEAAFHEQVKAAAKEVVGYQETPKTAYAGQLLDFNYGVEVKRTTGGFGARGARSREITRFTLGQTCLSGTQYDSTPSVSTTAHPGAVRPPIILSGKNGSIVIPGGAAPGQTRTGFTSAKATLQETGPSSFSVIPKEPSEKNPPLSFILDSSNIVQPADAQTADLMRERYGCEPGQVPIKQPDGADAEGRQKFTVFDSIP